MKKQTIGLTEKVVVRGKDKGFRVRARIDTGARYNSINEALAEKLGMIPHHQEFHIRAASGIQKRRSAHATLIIHKRKIRALFTIADRRHMRYQVLIGTRTLKGRFVIDPAKP